MGFDEFARELEKLGNIDEYAPELLNAAAPTLEKELKNQVSKATNKGYATGDLKESIKAKKPGKNVYGHYVMVTAEGKDKKGVYYGVSAYHSDFCRVLVSRSDLRDLYECIGV